MNPRVINRRHFLNASTNGVLLASIGPVACASGQTKSRAAESAATAKTQRIAAIQMEVVPGELAVNLGKAEQLAREAFAKRANWIVLPEFFAAGIGTSPKMLDAFSPLAGAPTKLLQRLAREGGCGVGGSFLAQRGDDTYNTFVLALPDGTIRTHDKDTPSNGTEATNYVGGEDDGVFDLGRMKIGSALCWELCRYKTARRLRRDQVDFVLAGSFWPHTPEMTPKERVQNFDMMSNAPNRLARLIGAPVAHANPCGEIHLRDGFTDGRKIKVEFLGESRIVDRAGETLVRRSRDQGEGVVMADVEVGHSSPSEDLCDELWITELPEFGKRWFYENRSKGSEAYRTSTRPRRNRVPEE